jgi:hypothetical protein
VYMPLRHRGRLTAVAASNAAGLVAEERYLPPTQSLAAPPCLPGGSSARPRSHRRDRLPPDAAAHRGDPTAADQPQPAGRTTANPRCRLTTPRTPRRPDAGSTVFSRCRRRPTPPVWGLPTTHPEDRLPGPDSQPTVDQPRVPRRCHRLDRMPTTAVMPARTDQPRRRTHRVAFCGRADQTGADIDGGPASRHTQCPPVNLCLCAALAGRPNAGRPQLGGRVGW